MAFGEMRLSGLGVKGIMRMRGLLSGSGFLGRAVRFLKTPISLPKAEDPISHVAACRAQAFRLLNEINVDGTVMADYREALNQFGQINSPERKVFTPEPPLKPLTEVQRRLAREEGLRLPPGSITEDMEINILPKPAPMAHYDKDYVPDKDYIHVSAIKNIKLEDMEIFPHITEDMETTCRQKYLFERLYDKLLHVLQGLGLISKTYKPRHLSLPYKSIA